ncbi:FHA domain-containing protein [Hyalangium sp.]|uniref:FHA domain-containing protein n=1 Tax=Hyalangium sp. TaxID=2028555 RepID=UPI003899AEF6
MAASKKEDVELPFDDDEVAPLQEDDPRPQRVPQYPAGPRRNARSPRGPRDGTKDRELATRFDPNEYSDPGYAPVFLYVEKGPGAGQLIPVKQGPLVIGRASACDLRLQHPSISRRHAQLMRQAERFVLRDLGSQNFTFVNRLKVTSDQEIQVGDEIALGNAVLKLRGPGVSSDKVPQVEVPVRAPARKGPSLTRVVLVAAAVGSAVAALLTVAFLKFSSSPRPAAPTGAQSAPPATKTPEQKAEEAYVPPPPASEEEHKPAAEAEEESPRALKPLQPKAEEATPSGHKSSGPRASTLKAKAIASRKLSAKSAKGSPQLQEPESEAPRAAEKAPVAAVDPADVRSRYEKGDVDGALSLAREGRVEPTATKIAQFQSEQSAGEQALKAQDTAGAIQHFAIAVMVDQELSQGWSVQGRNLRKQLGKLYTQTGQQQAKTGTRDAARESFEMALKYDPSNAVAKSELQQLGGKK